MGFFLLQVEKKRGPTFCFIVRFLWGELMTVITPRSGTALAQVCGWIFEELADFNLREVCHES